MMQLILEQALIALPLLLGAYMTLSLLKLPDFALESAYLMGAVGAYLAKDLPLPFVILASLSGGIVTGLMVSFFNQALKVPYLLAAIITNGIVHGAALFFMKGAVSRFSLLTSFSENALLITCACVVLSGAFFLFRSQMGYAFAIYGNNPAFFSHHRISGKCVMVLGVSLGHALAGLSGFLFAATSGVLDVTMNFGIVLLCLTSLMLGKLLFHNVRPGILPPVVGIIGYFTMQQLLLRAGMDLTYFNLFQALFVLGVIVFSKDRGFQT
jgi:ABC-type uncharacterized transport system permease subunit